MKERKCDNCRYYEWYYDLCKKWNCEVDARSVYSCFKSDKEADAVKEPKYSFMAFHIVEDGEDYWIFNGIELKGCVSESEKFEDAFNEFLGNEVAWLETAEQFGFNIPNHMKLKRREEIRERTKF